MRVPPIVLPTVLLLTASTLLSAPRAVASPISAPYVSVSPDVYSSTVTVTDDTGTRSYETSIRDVSFGLWLSTNLVDWGLSWPTYLTDFTTWEVESARFTFTPRQLQPSRDSEGLVTNFLTALPDPIQSFDGVLPPTLNLWETYAVTTTGSYAWEMAVQGFWLLRSVPYYDRENEILVPSIYETRDGAATATLTADVEVPAPVPEPSSLLLLSAGMGTAGLFRNTVGRRAQRHSIN